VTDLCERSVNGKHNSTVGTIHKTLFTFQMRFLLDSQKQVLSYLKRFNKRAVLGEALYEPCCNRAGGHL
jgi:hypothetical protein